MWVVMGKVQYPQLESWQAPTWLHEKSCIRIDFKNIFTSLICIFLSWTWHSDWSNIVSIVCFLHSDWSLLLTGSSDGHVRLWKCGENFRSLEPCFSVPLVREWTILEVSQTLTALWLGNCCYIYLSKCLPHLYAPRLFCFCWVTGEGRPCLRSDGSGAAWS